MSEVQLILEILSEHGTPLCLLPSILLVWIAYCDTGRDNHWRM